MPNPAIHERLRQARTARIEDLASVARRTGVREGLLKAIEDGRFDQLPHGIYARAAIRSYSVALGLDPDEILCACAPLLPAVEEPISGLARLRGIRSSTPAKAAARRPTIDPSDAPGWRLLAAATLDACVIVTMLLAVVASAAAATAVPISALGRPPAAAFGVMGVVLGTAYFVWFGGLIGATAGQWVFGLRPFAHDPDSLDLRTIAARALRCATGDVRFIEYLGDWLGSQSVSARVGTILERGAIPTPDLIRAEAQNVAGLRDRRRVPRSPIPFEAAARAAGPARSAVRQGAGAGPAPAASTR